MDKPTRFTVLPFLVSMFIAVFAMPTNVVAINRFEMGHEHTQPWRSTSLTSVTRAITREIASLRAALTGLWGHPLRGPALTATGLVLAAQFSPDAAAGLVLATVGAPSAASQLKALRQEAGEINARTLELNQKVADKTPLTDEERAELTKLRARAVDVKTSLTIAEEANEAERNAAPAASETERIEMGEDRATKKPWSCLGEMLMAVKAAVTPGTRQVDPRLFQAAATGLGTDVPSDGGFLVQKDMASGLIEKAYSTGEITKRVFRLPISENSDGVKINAIDETSRAAGSRFGGVRAYWVGQGDEITASKPRFSQVELNLQKIAALLYATDEMVKDVAVLNAIATRVVPMEINHAVEDSFVAGTGAGQPLGVLNAPCKVSVTKQTGQSADTVVYDNIKKMWSRMWAASRASAAWFINQDIEPQLFSLSQEVGTGGIPVYLPASGASDKPYATLFGRPVIPVEYCKTLGDEGDIILADWSQYVAIDKGGIEQAVSMHVRFIYDEMTFRFVYRVDGEPMWKSALTPQNGTLTLSPFVTLAERA